MDPIPQANNNPPAEDPYDGAPADWVAYVQTLPPCDNCNEGHAHLPGASKCLRCLKNGPGPQRRREMWRIIREGGHYCSSCYIREAPELGQSCPRCVNFRLAAKLLRKLNALLRPATSKMQLAHEAAESARNADTPLAAAQHAMRALATGVNVCKLLDRAGQILRELTEVDAAKGDAAKPNFLNALQRYREVAPLAQDVFVLAATRLGAQNDNNQGLMEALSNFDNFMPQIPHEQHGELQNQQGNIVHQHHGNHQHHVEDPVVANNNPIIPPDVPYQPQNAIAHQRHDDHRHHLDIQQPSQHPGQYPIQQPGQHPGQHPIQQSGQHPGQHPIQQPGQHPGQYPIQQPSQHLGRYPIQQPGQHIIQQNLTVNQQDGQYYLPVKHPLVDHNNVIPLEVPDLPGEHHHAPQQPDQNYHHLDNLPMYEDNVAPLVAPDEDNDIDEPHPDDILFNPYYQNQQYNSLRQRNY